MNPSIQKLAQLMQARREQGEPPYVLLLGSSLSLTPSVRRAFAGTEDWEAFWKDMQRASPTERKTLLKKPLDALGLEAGYQAMARLAEAGYFNLILTLNVDDAIDDAVRPLPADQSVLLIYDGSNTAQIVETLSRATPRIKVVKLRGDINAQALPLTATGTFEFPDDLERSVSEWLKRDLILVGDIPYDTDVQRCIKRSTGSLWCILPDEPASDSFIMRARQSRPSGEIITGADAKFNVFFTTLEEGPERVRRDDELDSQKELLLELIPIVPSHFVGRKGELAAYRKKLKEERLTIIKGMAGVGKTTLGAKLAREEAEREEQIFWFTFDLVEKNTAEALFWALAAFLKSRGKPDLWRYLRGEIDVHKSLEATVKLNLFFSSLSSGDYLLCFDDVQVVKDVSDIAELFKVIQKQFIGRRQDLPARFIIMGREVPSEMEYLVSESLAGFTEEETRTFVETQNLQLSPALLQQLWERTEGNAMLLDLSVSALTAMNGNLAAMERFIEAMARKGDTCDYVMNNIYKDLQPEEQEVADVLSIFSVPVEWEVVEEILAAEGITGVVPRIDALVDKHIVSEGENGRIHCHSLVREYCYRALDRKKKKRFHQRAADYYEQVENYLAAAYHHFQRDAQGQALDLLTAQAQDIINAGGAEALLEQLGRFQQRRLSLEQWVALCQARGDGHRMRGEYKQAVAAYKAALQGATGEEAQADLLREIGFTYHRVGEYKLAIEHFKESLKISETLGDQARVAHAHYAMGWANYRLGRLGEAREHFAVSRKKGRELEDRLLFAKTDLGLGLIDDREGRLEEARLRFEESRRVFREFGDRVKEADAIGNLAWVYSQMGDLKRALSLYHEIVESQKKIGYVHGLRITYNNLADLYYRLGDHTKAVHYYEKLAHLARDTGHKRMLSMACSGLADIHLAGEDLQRALEYAIEAHQVAREIGPSFELGIVYRVLGDIWSTLKDQVRAKACFERSIPLLEAAKEDEELTKARLGLKRVLSQLGADSS